MLTSLQNPLVKRVIALQRRKEREEAQEFVIEGRRFIEEALKRGANIKQVFICPERKQKDWDNLLEDLNKNSIKVEEIDERVLRKLSSTVEPQGILAVIKQQKFTWEDIEIDRDTVILVIDGIQDPGNLGTILRTALAAGIKYVCLTKGTVDLYNPKVLRSTMGAIFSLVSLPDCTDEDIINYCQERNLPILIADLEGESIYKPDILQLPLALVVGNEGNGPSLNFRNKADKSIVIPMKHEVESLNAAIATGILLYEIVRQRDFL